MKQKKKGTYWLCVLVGLVAAFVVGFHTTQFFSTGNFIVNEEFKTPHYCLFVSDCEKMSREKGFPLTCRPAFSTSREKSCLPPLIEGSRCTVSEDCAAGLTCAKPNVDALHSLCKRTPRKPGEMCQKREDCGENHTCVRKEGASFMTCQPFPKQHGGRCAATYDCPAGLKCIFSVKKTDGLVGECLPSRKQGESCRSEKDCEEGLYCRETRTGGRACMTGDEFKRMWRS